MKPPTVGPTIVERPNTAIRRPWYLPRSAGVKMSPMMAGEHGAGQERRDARQVEPFPAEDVGQLAEDRDTGGGGDQVARDHPAVVLQAVEVAHDLRHGGTDDRLVQGAEQHAQHHRPKGGELGAAPDVDEAVVQRDGGRGSGHDGVPSVRSMIRRSSRSRSLSSSGSRTPRNRRMASSRMPRMSTTNSRPGAVR